MKFFSFVALFLAVVACAQATNIPTTGRFSSAQVTDLRRRIVAAGGCNANVCFAIDGGSSLSSAEFRAEKDFVIDVAAVIAVDDAVEAAACQYGSGFSPIQPLTPNFANFVDNLLRASSLRANTSSLSGGLIYCLSQLISRPNEANKIVLLEHGDSTIGSTAIQLANLFRSYTGGEVCVVGSLATDRHELLAIAGGDVDNVFQVFGTFDGPVSQVSIEYLVARICNLPSF